MRPVPGIRRDTGIGLKDGDPAKLFRAFARINPGSRLEGTGLGLHLCRKLADLMGGRIEFQSEHGRGSRFTLLMPKTPGTTEAE